MIDFEVLGQLLFNTHLTPLLVVVGLITALIVAYGFVSTIRSAADE